MNPDQLQQALQQRDIFVQALVAFKETGDELEAERDAAIERGKMLWEAGAKANNEWQAWQDGCIEAEQEAQDAIERAEAAERALAEIDKASEVPKGYSCWTGPLSDVRLCLYRWRKSAPAEAQGRQAR